MIIWRQYLKEETPWPCLSLVSVARRERGESKFPCTLLLTRPSSGAHFCCHQLCWHASCAGSELTLALFGARVGAYLYHCQLCQSCLHKHRAKCSGCASMGHSRKPWAGNKKPGSMIWSPDSTASFPQSKRLHSPAGDHNTAVPEASDHDWLEYLGGWYKRKVGVNVRVLRWQTEDAPEAGEGQRLCLHFCLVIWNRLSEILGGKAGAYLQGLHPGQAVSLKCFQSELGRSWLI